MDFHFYIIMEWACRGGTRKNLGALGGSAFLMEMRDETVVCGGSRWWMQLSNFQRGFIIFVVVLREHSENKGCSDTPLLSTLKHSRAL